MRNSVDRFDRNFDRAFRWIPVLWALFALFDLALLVVIGIVAWHFLSKVW